MTPSTTIFSENVRLHRRKQRKQEQWQSHAGGQRLNNNRSETFTYDYLNRLTSAVTTGNAAPDCWVQSFTYDHYGSLYQIGATKCSPPSLSLAIPDPTTNRFSDSGFAYDSAGNMTNDGPPLNTPYTYNADSQMTTAGTTTFTYDGDGLRVKKSTASSAGGRPAAAHSLPRPTARVAR